jgi:3-phenylpropionate/trans-cinnamate dioxygenase ferredoxin subunit
MAWVTIGALDDFLAGGGTRVDLGGWSLAVFHVDGELFALANRCPHRGFPLHDGTTDGSIVRCRTHGSCFDLRSGAVSRGPARQGIATYRVEVVAGEVRVELPD